MDGITGMGNYCTRACDDAAGCPEGYVCASRTGLGRACTIGACSDGVSCPAGYHCVTPDPNQPENRVCRHDDIACTEDANCPGAMACNQGSCVSYCTTNADCKQGYMCHGDRGCVECMYAFDCTNDLACVAGQCGVGCVDATDCRAGYRCAEAACEVITGGGAGTMGDPCTQHDECADFCYGSSYCSRPCGIDGDASCGDGFECDVYHGVCEPAA
jgi:hypothetical protein